MLIVGALMLALVIFLSFQVGGWAAALTPFADTWDAFWAEALRLDPKSKIIRKDYGILLLNNGRLMEASILFADGVRLHPRDADAYNDLGVTLVRAGDLTDAAVIALVLVSSLEGAEPGAVYNRRAFGQTDLSCG